MKKFRLHHKHNKKMFEILLSEIVEEEEDEDSLSSSSEDSFIEIVLNTPVRNKRNCIRDYFETVVSSYTDIEFKRHFRLNRDLFNNLAEKYGTSAEYNNLDHYNTIHYKKQLAVFLWFAGHEACSYRDLADRFNLSLWTVHKIIYRVTKFISKMSDEVIRWPNLDMRNQVAARIQEKHNFPGVIGSIDGTHIVIDPPKRNKDAYIDRKGNVSICLQGICDDNKKFIDIFTGYPGSVHDSRLMKNSTIYEELQMLTQHGHYLLGDSAYPCQNYLLVPYKDNGHLTRAQKCFNQSLSKIRVNIEHTFGLLKQRFRQLYYCKLRNIETLCHFIRACCVLHNLSDQTDLEILEDIVLEEDEDPVNYEGRDENGRALRDNVCAYIFENTF